MQEQILKAITGISGHAPWRERKGGAVRAREKSVAEDHGTGRCLEKFYPLGKVYTEP